MVLLGGRSVGERQGIRTRGDTNSGGARNSRKLVVWSCGVRGHIPTSHLVAQVQLKSPPVCSRCCSHSRRHFQTPSIIWPPLSLGSVAFLTQNQTCVPLAELQIIPTYLELSSTLARRDVKHAHSVLELATGCHKVAVRTEHNGRHGGHVGCLWESKEQGRQGAAQDPA